MRTGGTLGKGWGPLTALITLSLVAGQLPAIALARSSDPAPLVPATLPSRGPTPASQRAVGANERATIEAPFTWTSVDPVDARGADQATDATDLRVVRDVQDSGAPWLFAPPAIEPTVPERLIWPVMPLMPMASDGMTVDPTSLTFPPQAVGTTSAYQQVNASVTSQTVDVVISIAGPNAGDFSQTNDCISPFGVGTCHIHVFFTPQAAGTRTATLQVRQEFNGPAHDVALAGTGTVPVRVISGTVRNGSGQLLSGIDVRIHRADGGAVAAQGTTGSNGVYALSVEDGHTYNVVFIPAQGSGYAVQVYNGQISTATATGVTVNGADVTGIDAALVTGWKVTGIVTDTAGHPLSGISVDVYLGGPACCYLIRSTTTDTTGFYLLELADGATYAVRFAGGTAREAWWNGHANPGNDVLTGWTVADKFAVSQSVTTPVTTTTYSCSGGQVTLIDNTNGFTVLNGGVPQSFTTPGGAKYCVTYVQHYHWNAGQGATPGSIGVQQGSTVLSASALASSGQGGAPNVNWYHYPPVGSWVIDGTWSCYDSDQTTWSQNSSQHYGFCIVQAIPQVATTTTTNQTTTTYGHPNTDAQLITPRAVTLSAACGPAAPKSTTVTATVQSFTPNSTTLFEVLDGSGAFVFRDGHKTLVSGGYTALFGMKQPAGTYTVRVTEDQNGNRTADAGEPSAAATFTVPCADGTGGDPAPVSHQKVLYALMINNTGFEGPAQSAIEIVDLSDMHLIRSIPLGSRRVASMAVSADGRRAYVADTTNGAVAVIDLVTGAQLANLATPSVRDVVLAPDGATLYVTTDLKLFAFDTVTNAKLRELASTVDGTRTDTFLSVAVSPDGATLSTIGFDGVTHWIYFVRASDFGILNRFAPSNPGEPSNCSTDPNDVAFVNGSTAVFWDSNCDNLYETASVTAGQNTAATIRVGRDDGSSSNYNNALSYSAATNTAYAHTEGIGIGGQLRGHVAILDRTSASSASIFGLVGTPFSTALTPDGKSLFVDVISRFQTAGVADRLDRFDTVTKTYQRGVYTFSDATMTARDIKIGAAPSAILITGTISDAATPATKIAGVHVDAIDATCADWTPSCATYGSTPSDVNGVFRIALPAGQWKFHFRPSFDSLYVQTFYGGGDFRNATAIVITGDTQVDQALKLGFRISGRVTDQNGAAVPGVGVSAVDVSQPCCSFFEGGGAGTGDNGDYAFAVPAGRWKVRFSPNTTAFAQQYYLGRQTFASADEVGGAAGAQATGVSAQLRPAIPVTGTVTDPATKLPVAGVFVRAFLPEVQPPDAVGESRTAADGTYAFGVETGTYRFVYNGNEVGYLRRFYDGKPGGTPSFDLAANVIIETTTTDVTRNMSLPKGVAVSGIVTDGTNGLENVGVNFEPADGGPGTGTATVSGGRYTALVEAGRYFVRFDPNDPASRFVARYWNDKATRASADVVDVTTPPTHSFDAVLRPGFFITGTITETGTTTPIANVQVTAISATCANRDQSCEQYWSRGTSYAAGRYSVTVPAGSWRLFFSVQDRSSPYVSTFYGGTRDLRSAKSVGVGPDQVRDMSLQRGIVVRGTISDGTTGVPRANAEFISTDNSGGFGFGTSFDGTYGGAVPAGQYTIRFEVNDPLSRLLPKYWNNKVAQGSADVVTLDATSTVTTFDAALANGYFITGTITEAGTSTPIAGVNVTAVAGAGACSQWQPSCEQYWSRIPSDSEGKYRITVPAGTWRLFFGPSQGSPFISAWHGDGQDITKAADVRVAGDTTVNTTLQRGILVSGRVTSGGVGQDNICACFQGVDAPFGQGFRTTTDGTYSGVLPLGRYTLTFAPNDPLSRLVRKFWNDKTAQADVIDLTVVAPPITTFNADLAPGFFITGTIRDSITNAPVAGINVQAASLPCGRPDPLCERYFMGPATDASGTYRITVPGGTWRVGFFPGFGSFYIQAWLGDGRDFSAARDIPVTGDTVADGTLVQGMRIRGHVSSATSAGIGGVNVEAIDVSQPCCASVAGTSTNRKPSAAAIGDFSFAVPAGTYKIRFTNAPLPLVAQYWQATTFAAAGTISGLAGQGADGIDVVLQTGFVISGKVTDLVTTNPVAGVFVNPVRAAAGPCFCDDPPGGASTAADGTYAFAVAAETYKIFVNGSRVGHLNRFYTGTAGGTRDFNVAATVVVGPDKPNIDTALGAGFFITGHVFQADGVTPVKGVSVSALDANQQGQAGASTDSTGFYRMLTPVGSWKVRFRPPAPLVQQYWQGSLTFAAATPVNLTTAPVGSVDASLQSGFTFSGKVTDADTGGALAGVNVNVRPSTPGSEVAGGTQTGSDGTYAVAALAGTYRLAFDGTNISPLHVRRFWTGTPGGVPGLRDAADIVVGPDQPNKDMALPLGYPIVGHVTAPDGTHPANVQVSPFDASQPCVLATSSCHIGGTGWITDPDGSGFFRLVVANGSYKIQVTPINGGTTTYLPQFFDRSRDFAGGATVTVTNGVVTLNNVAVSDVAVTLENGVRLTGKVVDAITTAGIGGINVNVDLGGATDACSPCVFENSAVTASDGTFTTYVHRNTTYKVQVAGDGNHLGTWYDGQLTFDTATPVPVQTADVALNVVRLAPGVQVSGTVTPPTPPTPPALSLSVRMLVATGLAGIRVTAFAVDATNTPGNVLAQAITDSEGRYSFFVPVGPFRLLFSSTSGLTYAARWSGNGADFLSAATLQAVAGRAVTVDMTMLPGFSISGHVRDAATATAISAGRVRLVRADRGTTVDSLVELAPLDETGGYWIVVAGGAFANYKLSFAPFPSTGYVRQFWNGKASYDTADSFTVLAPQVTDAALVAGVTVTGSLKDGATRALVAGAIEAYDNAGVLRAVGRSFADGPFMFNVPRGQLKFRFNAPGYAPFWWTSSLTSEGATVVDTNVSPLPVLDALLDKAQTDLSVTVVGPGRVGVVSAFDTVVKVHNGGNVAMGGRLTHVLPTGLTFVAVTESQGACTSYDTGTGSCDLGTIRPGGDATFTVRARAATPGTFTQVATVTAAGTDTNADNNTARLATTVPSDGVISGITQCGTILLPRATVSISAGSVLVARFASGADGSYTYGLAPDSFYTVLYRGTSAGATIACGVRVHTALAGGGITTIAPPALFPDLGNHSYATAWPLASGRGQTDYLMQTRISDWYVINVGAGQKITVDVYGTPADLTVALYGDIVAAKNRVATTATDTRLYGVAIAPGTDADIAPGTDADVAPGTDADVAPGTDADIAPGTDADVAPGTDADLAPGTDADIAPGTDADIAPGTDADVAPGTDADVAPGTDADVAPGTDADIAPGTSASLANGDHSTEVRTSLLAISANRGASVPERIVRQTFDRAGSYYVRVLGQPSTSAFTVKATVEDGECTGVSLNKYAASWPAGKPATTPKTLIIMNSSALRKADGTALTATEIASLKTLLQKFADRLEVGGAILDLALDTGFMQNVKQWTDNGSCPAAANVAAEVVRDMIAEYRKASPATLEYLVIVGPHGAVPHRLEPDRAIVGSETGYAPPVDNLSRSEATLRRDKVMTDDYYAATSPVQKLGELLYVPDLAVGRLVETYEDVVGALNAYLETTDGVVDVRPATGVTRRALVTSYDFLAKLGDDMKDAFAQSGMTVEQLQAQIGVKPTDPGAWTADDLRRTLLGAAHYDVIGLNAHFSAGTAWAANLSTLSATELAAINDGRYKHTLVLSNGCHTGYVVIAGDAVPNVTQKVDWAQTFVRQGANLIAGTGYMYGGYQLLNFDQVILANTVARLRLGTGPVSIGKALADAKHDYVNAYPSTLDATDLKALREVVLYGLPMTKYDLGGRTPITAPPAIQPQPVRPGATLAATEIRAGANEVSSDTPGLSARPYKLNQHKLTLNVQGGGTADVSYYDADGQTTSLANKPVLPKTVIDVATNGGVALGAVLVSADITRIPNWRPFTDATATDSGVTYPNFVSATDYPKLPFSLSLLAGQSLVLNQLQYRSDGQLVTGTASRFDHMTLRVYTTTATGAAATLAPPTFARTRLVPNGTAIRVITVVASDADVEEVLATYTAAQGEAAGHYRSIRLTGGPNLSTSVGFVREFIGDIETGSVDGLSAYRVLLQAVGANGAVSTALNGGDLFSVAPVTVAVAPALAPPKDTAASLVLSGSGVTPGTASTPPSVTFGSTLEARAVLTDTGTGAPVTGRSLSFSLGARAVTMTTDNAGAAVARFTVTAEPGTATVSVAFFGDTAYAGTGRSTDVTVVRAPTGFVTSAGRVLYRDTTPLATLVSGPTTLGRGSKRVALAPVVISLGAQSLAALTDPFGRVIVDTRALPLTDGNYTLTLTYPGNFTYSNASAAVDVLVDTTPPAITTSPTNGATFLLAQAGAVATYSCADALSAVATCTATLNGTPIASGASISTAVVGPQRLVVSTSDTVGNSATKTVDFAVSYKLCLLYDPSLAKKLGSVVPIKLQICDANGANRSASGLVLHGLGARQVSTNAPGLLEAAGSANPDNDFRFDASLGGTGGYIFNLDTSPLSLGTWAIRFTVGSQTYVYEAQFQVK